MAEAPIGSKAGAWIAIILIIVGFGLGLLALILMSWWLAIVAAVVGVAGVFFAFTSKIMDQVH